MGTIYVQHKGFKDPVMINEEDFDSKVHKHLDEKVIEKMNKAAEKQTPAEGDE